MKEVLLVEDNADDAKLFIRALTRAGYAVHHISKLPASCEDPEYIKLVANTDESLIALVLDAQLHNGHKPPVLTHEGHIQAAARVFKGPMIGTSSRHDYRELQRSAGCHHTVENKDPGALVRILKECLRNFKTI